MTTSGDGEGLPIVEVRDDIVASQGSRVREPGLLRRITRVDECRLSPGTRTILENRRAAGLSVPIEAIGASAFYRAVPSLPPDTGGESEVWQSRIHGSLQAGISAARSGSADEPRNARYEWHFGSGRPRSLAGSGVERAAHTQIAVGEGGPGFSPSAVGVAAVSTLIAIYLLGFGALMSFFVGVTMGTLAHVVMLTWARRSRLSRTELAADEWVDLERASHMEDPPSGCAATMLQVAYEEVLGLERLSVWDERYVVDEVRSQWDVDANLFECLEMARAVDRAVAAGTTAESERSLLIVRIAKLRALRFELVRLEQLLCTLGVEDRVEAQEGRPRYFHPDRGSDYALDLATVQLRTYCELLSGAPD